MNKVREGQNPESQGASAIETKALVKDYESLSALKGLDLEVPYGGTFGLLGPNGAGKSTTIKLLMGLIKPTSGSAHVLGFDTQQDSHVIRGSVGYVPERQRMYGWMTVQEIIKFTSAFYPSWDEEMQRSLLRQYDLNPKTKVKALSSGMATKLALLLALSHRPKLLILDEPTTGLDPLIREEFLDGVLKSMDREKRTVFFSSHILSDIERIADTVGIINDGRLLICSPMNELVSKTKRLRVQLKSADHKLELPSQTIWHVQENGFWHVTIHAFTQDTIDQVKQQDNVASCDVVDLNLEEVFKDFIRGQRKV